MNACHGRPDRSGEAMRDAGAAAGRSTWGTRSVRKPHSHPPVPAGSALPDSPPAETPTWHPDARHVASNDGPARGLRHGGAVDRIGAAAARGRNAVALRLQRIRMRESRRTDRRPHSDIGDTRLAELFTARTALPEPGPTGAVALRSTLLNAPLEARAIASFEVFRRPCVRRFGASRGLHGSKIALAYQRAQHELELRGLRGGHSVGVHIPVRATDDADAHWRPTRIRTGDIEFAASYLGELPSCAVQTIVEELHCRSPSQGVAHDRIRMNGKAGKVATRKRPPAATQTWMRTKVVQKLPSRISAPQCLNSSSLPIHCKRSGLAQPKSHPTVAARLTRASLVPQTRPTDQRSRPCSSRNTLGRPAERSRPCSSTVKRG